MRHMNCIKCNRYAGYLVDESGTKGPEFDSGRITFTAGKGEVVPGLDEGIASLREGGARTIMVRS